ncbi:MAG: aldo/keto reductase [Rhodobacteraceae bacterium]|nr:MAG: aldo/keto reductase [Paracoccaceae bacterium]
MKQRKLGKNGIDISALGLGCMSFAGFFGPTDEPTSHACLDAARDIGINHLDTSDIYGMGVSETMVGTYLAKNPNAFKIATKCGIRIKPIRCFDNSEAYIRDCFEASTKRLGVDYFDLYYVHRREADRPIEEVAETMGKLIDEGKIGAWGLSEVAPATIRRAHAVTPLGAVQNEYSLWTRLPELGVIQTCEKLGITFVPFSPVGRGVFTQSYPDMDTVAPTEFRRNVPRFQEPNYSYNKALIDPFKAYCSAMGWTVSATVLAWILDQNDTMVPIPATRTAEHLLEWKQATEITFSEADRAEIDRLLPVGFAYGDRYSDANWVGPEKYC